MNDDSFRAAFLEEAREQLQDMEAGLLELEDEPGSTETLHRVFRALHTIKGSGSMFGFNDIAAFAHNLETAFDQARDGKLQVTRALLDLALSSVDLIRGLLTGSDSPEAEGERSRIAEAINALVAGSPDSPEQTAEEPAVAPLAAEAPAGMAADSEEAEAIYSIRFRPSPHIFLSGLDPSLLFDELRCLGDCRIFAHTDNVPPLDENFDPLACHVWWDAVLVTAAVEDAVRDVFIFVSEDAELTIRRTALPAGGQAMKIGEILVERGDLTAEEMESFLGAQKPIGRILSEAGRVTSQQVASALAEQAAVRETLAQRRQTADTAHSIRVSEDKLDRFVDLVGELVILQSRLAQESRRRGKKDRFISGVSEELERLSDDLRYYTLKMRMLPFGTMFNRFRRLVRDLSAELGKEVEFVTEGAATELDKTVIDRLVDPMLHLLRNSLDHGIEPPAERIARGKPARGTVRVSAIYAGGEVRISVADDGAGIDPARVLAKAKQRGLVPEDREPDVAETVSLIFHPGFSTADKVSSVSGRGVGMDVVQRAIEALGGSIAVDPGPGRGAAFTIRLPLTMAIIDGLVVKIGPESYIIPLSVIEECVDIRGDIRDESPDASSRRLAPHRGGYVPYVSLRDHFGIEGSPPALAKMIVTSIEGHKAGIVVDHIIGQYQTVIKNIGAVYKHIGSISGASINGDGSVVLILDVPFILASVRDGNDPRAALPPEGATS